MEIVVSEEDDFSVLHLNDIDKLERFLKQHISQHLGKICFPRNCWKIYRAL